MHASAGPSRSSTRSHPLESVQSSSRVEHPPQLLPPDLFHPVLVPHRHFLVSLLVSALVAGGAALFRRRLFRVQLQRTRSLSRSIMAPPSVDLVVVFRASTNAQLKGALREDAQQAEQQYARLLETLRKAGLTATGRRGEKQGQLMILVFCPQGQLGQLVQRERHSDFLHGLSTSNLSSIQNQADLSRLSPADRLRIIHSYITSTSQDGGLGIIPGTSEWSRVESVMALQDHDFNYSWIRTWSTHSVGSEQLDRIKVQFGEAVALYFSFLHTYTHFLIFPSALGIAFYFVGTPYSPLYSVLLLLWATTFVEWWRVRERLLAVRWGTRGAFRVEKRRAEYTPDFPWYRKEGRAIASVPVIFMFAGILASLLTGIFVFEAFVTNIYTGPGNKYISLAPTVLFIALVPRVLEVYHTLAVRFTKWENHAHQSAYDASLTIKTFSLSAIVAYLGLALSAFVYVPFGGEVMGYVQAYLFKKAHLPTASLAHSAASVYASVAQNAEVSFNTTSMKGAADKGLWETDELNARSKLNPSRLQDQMFAYTVTNQVINLFLEVGLPFVLRAVDSLRNGKGLSGVKPGSAPGSPGKKKRVVFEDETKTEGNSKEERELLERIRNEVGLPEYELFGDYSEMVTQFGYVVLWSTIWPLAPFMAMLNNWLELRSDAYKITVHQRRPIPVRSDTIGPWLDSLLFLSWLGALTNSALVYLFHPLSANRPLSTELKHDHPITAEVVGEEPQTARQLLLGATVVALCASHGFILVRWAIRHTIERAVWQGSREVKMAEEADRTVKENYLRNVGVGSTTEDDKADGAATSNAAFWEYDEGLNEIRGSTKQE